MLSQNEPRLPDLRGERAEEDHGGGWGGEDDLRAERGDQHGGGDGLEHQALEVRPAHPAEDDGLQADLGLREADHPGQVR